MKGEEASETTRSLRTFSFVSLIAVSSPRSFKKLADTALYVPHQLPVRARLEPVMFVDAVGGSGGEVDI